MSKRLPFSSVKILCGLCLIFISSATQAEQSLVKRWIEGLAGAKLTSYSGSVLSSNSTLTVVKFCRNGRYSYSREGSWSASGSAGGASNTRIAGRWDIEQNDNQVFLSYVTDDGQSGALPIYLRNDGKVNIYGASFSVQPGGAGC